MLESVVFSKVKVADLRKIAIDRNIFNAKESKATPKKSTYNDNGSVDKKGPALIIAELVIRESVGLDVNDYLPCLSRLMVEFDIDF